jgi:hypothetical protein
MIHRLFPISTLSVLKARFCLLVLCLLISASGGMAMADCQASYNQAVTLLDTTMQKASGKERPNPDAFAAEFKTVVGSMQSQKCMPELMSLIQHIQTEQQKLPHPSEPAGKHSNAPITD